MDFFENVCPVCSKKFLEGEDIVVCPKCGAPYHRECYKEKGKCIFIDLHKNKKSWREVYGKTTEEKQDDKQDMIKCPVCSRENEKSAVVCKYCGSFLSIPDIKFVDENDEQFTPFSEDDFPEGFNILGDNNPFSVFIDPMGGVAKDEDFDGVSGAEAAKFVKANTPYYMRIFYNIKKENKSRFNFAAFFFTGIWYCYRKQYLKGTVISVIYLVCLFANFFVTNWYTDELWRTAASAISESGINYPTYSDYFSWILSNNSAANAVIMFVPYMINMFLFILKLVCGFRGNRSYYKNVVNKIKKIKNEKDSKTAAKTISETGGVNTPLAWSMFACYMILAFAFSLF